jgi:hypothetical protein
VPIAARRQIESQKSRLAAIDSKDREGQEAIASSFVAGFRGIAWISAGLALASSGAAAFFLSSLKRKPQL